MESIKTPQDARYDKLESNPSVVTPESVKKEATPDHIYAYTRKYGETVSTLKPGFESKVDKYENLYEMNIPDEVLSACKEIYGLGGRALLVGGSVRDMVFSAEFPEARIKPKDFDLEVYGMSAEQLQLILETKFGSSNIDNVGRAFGIIKVKIQGWKEPLDFSIPKRGSKTGEGHKGFTIHGDPTMTIDEASLRRDLTINSIAYDPLTKTLYDVYGGIRDIKNRIIDITDIDAFQEDPLRVVRVMQFASRLEFDISQRTLDLCTQMVERGDLDKLARERIAEEVTKLFTKGKKPSLGFEFARQVGFINRYWPEVNALINTPQETSWHPEGDVWTHTLQCMDAAAEIADREIKAEKMKEEDKIFIVGASLCHAFGKPPTTEFIEGAYRSRGHEPAGVPLARNFIERIFADPKAKGVSEITKKVLPLVAEHLKPKDLWNTETHRNIDQAGAVRKLARRLAEGDKKLYPDGGGTNIYMLSLVVEADQRGRNGQKGKHLSREQVSELEQWQKWLLTKSEKLNVTKKPPERILTGKMYLKEKSGKGGPWLGAVLDAVYADQLEGLVKTPEEALIQGQSYLEQFTRLIKEHTLVSGEPEYSIWEKVRNLEDPRTYISQEEKT